MVLTVTYLKNTDARAAVEIGADDYVPRSFNRCIGKRNNIMEKTLDAFAAIFSLRYWTSVPGVAVRAIFNKRFIKQTILTDYVQ